MDKSSITWTRWADWWLSRTTMSGKERYPKQIRVGYLGSPRVYYSVNRDALLRLADEIDLRWRWTSDLEDRDAFERWARRIREALGVQDA